MGGSCARSRLISADRNLSRCWTSRTSRSRSAVGAVGHVAGLLLALPAEDLHSHLSGPGIDLTGRLGRTMLKCPGRSSVFGHCHDDSHASSIASRRKFSDQPAGRPDGVRPARPRGLRRLDRAALPGRGVGLADGRHAYLDRRAAGASARRFGQPVDLADVESLVHELDERDWLDNERFRARWKTADRTVSQQPGASRRACRRSLCRPNPRRCASTWRRCSPARTVPALPVVDTATSAPAARCAAS